jgi:hypothetical protein
MDCPVQAAQKEIRGGWDAWNDDGRTVTVGGVTYCCQEAVTAYTFIRMQYARLTLVSDNPRVATLFTPYVGKTHGELFTVLAAALLGRLTQHINNAVSAVLRAFSAVEHASIFHSYAKKTPVYVPAFEPPAYTDLAAYVNYFVEHSKHFPSVDIPLVPPFTVDEHAAEVLPSDPAKCMEGLTNVFYGVGRREAELAHILCTLQNVEKSAIEYAGWLRQ